MSFSLTKLNNAPAPSRSQTFDSTSVLGPQIASGPNGGVISGRMKDLLSGGSLLPLIGCGPSFDSFESGVEPLTQNPESPGVAMRDLLVS